MARITLHEYLDEARQCIDDGAHDEAINICRHILQRYPQHVRTYQILGEACLEKGEFEEAADIFERILQQADPESFVAHAGLGILREEQGRITEAIWYMERAFEIVPNNEEVRNALRRLYGKRDGEEPTRIKHNRAALARLYLRGGQYRQAIEKLRDLMDEDDNRERMDLQVALAETLWRDERREQATETARAVLEAVPNCLKATLILGMIHIEKGLEEQAQGILEAARSLDPENRVAESLFGERSPLPPLTVKVPRIQEAVSEGPAPEPEELETAEEPAEMAAVEEPAETEVGLEAEDLGAGEPVEKAAEAALEERAGDQDEAPEAALEEPVPSLEQPLAAAPSETMAAAVAQPEPEAAAPEEEPAEAAPPEMPEPVEEVLSSRPSEEEASAAEAPPVPTVAPSPPPDVERYKQQLERHPKNDEVRLALARAYADHEQMQPALEQYSILKRSTAELLAQVVRDMENIVASRPDNLQAHELLADLYVKDGRLQQAVERYRWVLNRLEDKTTS